MTTLQNLGKEFQKEHPSKGMQYICPDWDFSSIQLDGYFSSEDLRNIADSLDKYNKKAANE